MDLMENLAVEDLGPQYAISVRQPWAHLILCGYKRVEYRTWRLPEKYWKKWKFLHVSSAFAAREKSAAMRLQLSDLQFGGYVAHIMFEKPMRKTTPDEISDYIKGSTCWHWPIRHVILTGFIPAKGKQGIFTV